LPITRRAAGRLLAGATLAAPKAFAQSAWPDRPVHLVVTFVAGGANDLIARLVGERLSARLGQSFVIDNKSGAGGNVGAEFVARQRPDGYTYLQLSNASAANTSLYPSLGYDVLRDFAPVAGVYDVPFLVVTRPDFPARDLAEFIAYAKANPGKLSHASGGTGSVSHIAAELMKMMAGIEMTHVPYRGSPLSLGELIGGRIDSAFDPIPSSLSYVQDGRLKVLAVTSAKRSPLLPDVPSVSEFLPGYDATSWTGTAGPKGLPADIVDRFSREMDAVLSEPGVARDFARLGATPLRLAPAAFAEKLAAETRKWADVIAFAKIKPE
jgi:tripartite-type tricarboxylate transporter receptor subunit TctC